MRCHQFRSIHGLDSNGGHENIIRLCHEWGATDIDKAMVCAACKSHKFIVRLCRDCGAHEIDWAMAYAAQEGRESTVGLCRNLGVIDVNRAMVSAACNGHESILRLCRDWGGVDFNTAMAHAASYSHVRIMILCHRLSATDLKWAMACTERGVTKKSCNCVTSGPLSIWIEQTYSHHHRQSYRKKFFGICFGSADVGSGCGIQPSIHQGLSYGFSSISSCLGDISSTFGNLRTHNAELSASLPILSCLCICMRYFNIFGVRTRNA